MKVFILALCLAALVSGQPIEERATCTSNSKHNLVRGVCDDKMTLVHTESVEVDANWLPPSSTQRDIFVPEEGGLAKPIKCIKITDRVENNGGGCPSIAEGGVGMTHAHIRLTSQFAKKMIFDVEVYIDGA